MDKIFMYFAKNVPEQLHKLEVLVFLLELKS